MLFWSDPDIFQLIWCSGCIAFSLFPPINYFYKLCVFSFYAKLQLIYRDTSKPRYIDLKSVLFLLNARVKHLFCVDRLYFMYTCIVWAFIWNFDALFVIVFILITNIGFKHRYRSRVYLGCSNVEFGCLSVMFLGVAMFGSREPTVRYPRLALPPIPLVYKQLPCF